MTQPAPLDLALVGGRIIDPANGLDTCKTLVIHNGVIHALLDPDRPVNVLKTVDVRNLLVIPGMIDTHGHVFQHVTGRFGLDADLCGVQSGVTCSIDQGGPSCMTLPAFRRYVVEAKKTRVFAYLSAYLVGGLEGHYYPSLYRPDCVDVAATVKAALANPDIVRGFKAHAELGGFARWGIDVMRQSSDIARQAGLPLYIHFGQLWPLPETGSNGIDADEILAAVVPLLKAGDILAHPFTRHPGGFVDRQGRVHGIVREALARGLKIDVGHGSHFSFRMARIALDAGIRPHTLGADMHGYNTPVPALPGTPAGHSDEEHMFFGKVRFSLTSAMTAMLALGLPLSEVIDMVTRRVVDIFGLPSNLGALTPGNPADVSVLRIDHGRFVLRDNEDTEVISSQRLQPVFCLRDGERYDATASILPERVAAALS